MLLVVLFLRFLAKETTATTASMPPVTVTSASTSSNGTHPLMTSQSIDLTTQEGTGTSGSSESTTTGYAVSVSLSTGPPPFETEITSEAPRTSQNAPDVFIIAISATCALIALIILAAVVLSVLIQKRIKPSQRSKQRSISTQGENFNSNTTTNTPLEVSTEQEPIYEEIPEQCDTTFLPPSLDRVLTTHVTCFTAVDSSGNNGGALNSQQDLSSQGSTPVVELKSSIGKTCLPGAAKNRPGQLTLLCYPRFSSQTHCAHV